MYVHARKNICNWRQVEIKKVCLNIYFSKCLNKDQVAQLAKAQSVMQEVPGSSLPNGKVFDNIHFLRFVHQQGPNLTFQQENSS